MDKDFVSKITSGEFADDQFVIDECGPFYLQGIRKGFVMIGIDWMTRTRLSELIRPVTPGWR